MKIALIAPIEETVPPQKYGGTEWIVYHLAHGLGAKGHQVDLYASKDTKPEPFFKTIPIFEKSIRNDPTFGEDSKLRETVKYAAVAESIKRLNTKSYDIIHNHSGIRFLLFSKFLREWNKIVSTSHLPLSISYHKWVLEQYKDYRNVSISFNQRRDLPDLNFIANVYNGIDPTLFPFSNGSNTKDDYLLFLARMSPEKGAIEAAKVAMKLKKKLIVAAKVDVVDREYFKEFNSIIDKTYVKFVGEIGPRERASYLQKAACLFVPIAWEEPFGLMFTEAMCCGTPVVTYARGSVPEIIVDGKTGFIVNSSETDKRGDFIVKTTGLDGLSEAVEKVYSLGQSEYSQMRLSSRKRVEENFTIEKMVNGYEEVFKRIMKGL